MLIEDAIKDIVTRLYDVNWFENCGKNNAVSEYNISYAKDVNSVIKHCSSTRWENLTLDRSEDVSSYLVINEIKGIKTPYTWNEVIYEIKKDIVPTILKKAEEKWNAKFDESEEVIGDLRWNVVSIIALSAFREYKISKFHEELLRIYEQGHFPCGWKGTFPEGKIIIW